MEREIKFRAWDKRNNAFNKLYTNADCMHNLAYDNVVISQFTGFTDKNGKEIYDGDILSCKVNVDGEIVNSINRVFWNSKVGAWYLDNSYKQDCSSGDLLSEELGDFNYEITGNIYEK